MAGAIERLLRSAQGQVSPDDENTEETYEEFKRKVWEDRDAPDQESGEDWETFRNNVRAGSFEQEPSGESWEDFRARVKGESRVPEPPPGPLDTDGPTGKTKPAPPPPSSEWKPYVLPIDRLVEEKTRGFRMPGLGQERLAEPDRPPIIETPTSPSKTPTSPPQQETYGPPAPPGPPRDYLRELMEQFAPDKLPKGPVLERVGHVPELEIAREKAENEPIVLMFDRHSRSGRDYIYRGPSKLARYALSEVSPLGAPEKRGVIPNWVFKRAMPVMSPMEAFALATSREERKKGTEALVPGQWARVETTLREAKKMRRAVLGGLYKAAPTEEAPEFDEQAFVYSRNMFDRYLTFAENAVKGAGGYTGNEKKDEALDKKFREYLLEVATGPGVSEEHAAALQRLFEKRMKGTGFGDLIDNPRKFFAEHPGMTKDELLDSLAAIESQRGELPVFLADIFKTQMAAVDWSMPVKFNLFKYAGGLTAASVIGTAIEDALKGSPDDFKDVAVTAGSLAAFSLGMGYNPAGFMRRGPTKVRDVEVYKAPDEVLARVGKNLSDVVEQTGTLSGGRPNPEAAHARNALEVWKMSSREMKQELVREILKARNPKGEAAARVENEKLLQRTMKDSAEKGIDLTREQARAIIEKEGKVELPTPANKIAVVVEEWAKKVRKKAGLEPTPETLRALPPPRPKAPGPRPPGEIPVGAGFPSVKPVATPSPLVLRKFVTDMAGATRDLATWGRAQLSKGASPTAAFLRKMVEDHPPVKVMQATVEGLKRQMDLEGQVVQRVAEASAAPVSTPSGEPPRRPSINLEGLDPDIRLPLERQRSVNIVLRAVRGLRVDWREMGYRSRKEAAEYSGIPIRLLGTDKNPGAAPDRIAAIIAEEDPSVQAAIREGKHATDIVQAWLSENRGENLNVMKGRLLQSRADRDAREAAGYVESLEERVARLDRENEELIRRIEGRPSEADVLETEPPEGVGSTDFDFGSNVSDTPPGDAAIEGYRTYLDQMARDLEEAANVTEETIHEYEAKYAKRRAEQLKRLSEIEKNEIVERDPEFRRIMEKEQRRRGGMTADELAERLINPPEPEWKPGETPPVARPGETVPTKDIEHKGRPMREVIKPEERKPPEGRESERGSAYIPSPYELQKAASRGEEALSVLWMSKVQGRVESVLKKTLGKIPGAREAGLFVRDMLVPLSGRFGGDIEALSVTRELLSSEEVIRHEKRKGFEVFDKFTPEQREAMYRYLDRLAAGDPVGMDAADKKIPINARLVLRQLQHYTTDIALQLMDHGIIPSSVINDLATGMLFRATSPTARKMRKARGIPRIQGDVFLRYDYPWVEVNMKPKDVNVAMQEAKRAIKEGKLLFPDVGEKPRYIKSKVPYRGNLLVKFGSEQSRDAFIAYMRKARRGREIVRSGNPLTDEERKAIGEIFDVGTSVEELYARSYWEIKKANYLRVMSRIPTVTAPLDFTVEEAKASGYTRLVPDRWEYGALRGRMVKPDVYDAVTSITRAPGAIRKFWIELRGMWKQGKTSLSSRGHYRQLIGNSLMSLHNGITIWNPLNFHYYIEWIGHMGKKSDLWVEGLKHGISQTSYSDEELKLFRESLTWRDVKNLTDLIMKINRNPLFQAAGRVYSYEDEIFRGAHFIKLMRENGMTPAEAAQRVALLWPNYREVGKLVKVLRDVPFMGAFLTYDAEVAKAIINQARLKPWRTVAYFAVAELMRQLGRKLLGLTDEEEDAIDDTYGKWWCVVGRDDDGNPVIWDLRWIMPGADLIERLPVIGYGAPDPFPGDEPGWLEHINDTLGPWIESPERAILGLATNWDFWRKKEIGAPWEDADTTQSRALAEMLGPDWTPYVGRSWRKFEQLVTTGKDRWGNDLDPQLTYLDAVIGIIAKPYRPEDVLRNLSLARYGRAKKMRSDMYKVAFDQSITDTEREARIKKMADELDAMSAEVDMRIERIERAQDSRNLMKQRR